MIKNNIILLCLACIFFGCPDDNSETSTVTIPITEISLLDENDLDSGEIWTGSFNEEFPVFIKIIAHIEPDNATDKSIIWSLDPEAFINLTVMPDGISAVITALEPGGPTIVTVTTKDDNLFESYAIMVLEPDEPPENPGENKGIVVYNFSTSPLNTLSTSTLTEVITLGGLTFGTGNNLLAQNASASGMSFTHCLRTNGTASSAQRYVVIPLLGPAKVTLIGASNNSTAANINVTETVESSVNITVLPFPGWVSGGASLGTPEFISTKTGPHTLVLKSAASARYFYIEVDYDFDK